METGKRNVPENWAEEIIHQYYLNPQQAEELKKVAENSAKSIKLELDNLFGLRKETAILFAREFENADDTTVSQIRNLLKKQGRE